MNYRLLTALSAIISIRMLGLFMILPVLALYSKELIGATPFTLGLALGAYGLSQACLQIPFGILSDRFGRKAIIAAGLILFILGSLICAQAETITLLIIGRLLQGMGAISGVIIALNADITPVAQRPQAMAILGIAIGLSFILALSLAPLINAYLQLHGLFYLNAVLGVLALILLYYFIPVSKKQISHYQQKKRWHLITNKQLLTLNISIFSLHAILTSIFLLIPVWLNEHFAITAAKQSYIYIMTIGLSVIPALALLRKLKKHVFYLFQFALVLMAISCTCFIMSQSHYQAFLINLFCFFIAFNILEACLPSFVSQIAAEQQRGSAMGIYASCQFLGAFCGGSVGGILLSMGSSTGLLIMHTVLLLGCLALTRYLTAIRQ